MAADAVRPYDELVDEIAKAGGASLHLCYQCGVCTATCPWGEVRDVSLRKMLRLAQLGLGGLEGDFLWLCTTCRACVARCPRGVEVIDVIRAARRFVSGIGMEPEGLKTARAHMANVGNPWGSAREARVHWSQGLHVKAHQPGTDVLLFVGCTGAFDPRVRKVAHALVNVLHAAGVTFGVLGNDEVCDGDPALSMGDVDLFQRLASQNIEAFRRHGVRRIVTISPHSYNVLKKEYPKLGSEVEVEHHTEFLARLADEGRIPWRSNGGLRVTYQDPCYLGRHNNVYEAPRKALESVPGLQLEEMERSKAEGLCCGGGGGRIFLETPSGERFSDLRIAHAERTGAATLCTACPYCLLTLEDSAKTVAKAPVAVMDVAEVVAANLAAHPKA